MPKYLLADPLAENMAFPALVGLVPGDKIRPGAVIDLPDILPGGRLNRLRNPRIGSWKRRPARSKEAVAAATSGRATNPVYRFQLSAAYSDSHFRTFRAALQLVRAKGRCGPDRIMRLSPTALAGGVLTPERVEALSQFGSFLDLPPTWQQHAMAPARSTAHAA